MTAPKILDLQTILPPRRVIKVPERVEPSGILYWIRAALRRLGFRLPERVRIWEIDLTAVPLGVALQIDQYTEEILQEIAERQVDRLDETAIELLITVCRPFIPGVDAGWIKRNLTADQAIAMFNFILEPLKERAEELARQAERISPKKN